MDIQEIKASLYDETREFTEGVMANKDYFVCMYGSYATEHFRPDSDLDILFAQETYNPEDYEKIKEFVVSLHTRNGLTIDEEVPYENKLLVPYGDIVHATNLDAFNVKERGGFEVPAIPNDAAFLASHEVRSRLILNCLTTPHVFVSGNYPRYQELKLGCERALIQLAHGLIEIDKPDETEILHALLVGPNGETGQAHLGYKGERAEVAAYLKLLIERSIEPNDV